MTRRREPQAVFASESLGQALRQLEVYGHDGLPVLSADGQHIQGWIAGSSVVRAIARKIRASEAETTEARAAADWAHGGPETTRREPSTPLPGYRLIEVTATPGSPAAGRELGAIDWPPGCVPVAVVHNGKLHEPRRLQAGRVTAAAPAARPDLTQAGQGARRRP